MRSRFTFALAAFIFVSLASSAQADAPRGSEEPTGATSTYRVTVGPQWAGTGVAISRTGWVITGKNLTDHCPPAPEHCAIWVEDAQREIWRRAAVVATDPRIGLALLRTESPLPEAAALATRPVRSGEPVHTYVFDGNDRQFAAGNARGTGIVTLFGDPPASGRVVISTLEHRDGFVGAGVFNIADDRLLGVLIGTVDGEGVTGTVAATSADVRALYDRGRAEYARQQRQTAAAR